MLLLLGGLYSKSTLLGNRSEVTPTGARGSLSLGGGVSKLLFYLYNILIDGYGHLVQNIWSGFPSEQIRASATYPPVRHSLVLLELDPAKLIQLKIASILGKSSILLLFLSPIVKQNFTERVYRLRLILVLKMRFKT